MPSDTFAEAIKIIDTIAARIKGSVEMSIAEDPDHAHNGFALKHLTESVELSKAARLLDAAGRECRAGREEEDKEEAYLYSGSRDSQVAHRAAADALSAARAALDALAPEMQEVGR